MGKVAIDSINNLNVESKHDFPLPADIDQVLQYERATATQYVKTSINCLQINW